MKEYPPIGSSGTLAVEDEHGRRGVIWNIYPEFITLRFPCDNGWTGYYEYSVGLEEWQSFVERAKSNAITSPSQPSPQDKDP